jgi:hypothetical protein
LPHLLLHPIGKGTIFHRFTPMLPTDFQKGIVNLNGKPEVEPDTLLYNLDGKTIPFISWMLYSGTHFPIMA